MNSNTRRFFILFLLYLVLWTVISVQIPGVFAAVCAFVFALLTPKLFTLPRIHVAPKHATLLFAYFLYNSVKAGFSVARLALTPGLSLRPFIHTINLENCSPFVSVILANIYSLMPGTISMDISNGSLQLHILDESLFDSRALETTKTKCCQAFKEAV